MLYLKGTSANSEQINKLLYHLKSLYKLSSENTLTCRNYIWCHAGFLDELFSTVDLNWKDHVI